MDDKDYIQHLERELNSLRIELDSQTRKAESKGNDPRIILAWLESDSRLLNAYVAVKGLDNARQDLTRLKREYDNAVLEAEDKLYKYRPAKIPDDIRGPLIACIEIESLFNRPPRQIDKSFVTSILQKHDRWVWPRLQSGLKELVSFHKAVDRFAYRDSPAWQREFEIRAKQARTRISQERQGLEQSKLRCEAEQRKVLRPVAERLCIDQKNAIESQSLVVQELKDLIPLSAEADLIVKQQQDLLIQSHTKALREQISEYELKLRKLKTQLAASLAEAEKKRLEAEHQHIQKAAHRKSIRGLIHFTQISNLPKICKHGILSRHACESLAIDTAANDGERFDRLLDFISLSISWPNWELFWRFRKNSEAGDDQWCVLVLNPNILWTLDCIFTAHNAASSTESNRSIDERKGFAAFERLFDDTGSAPLGLKRTELHIPAYMPTCHQAEVMVRRCVPWDRVLRVIVSSPQAMRRAKDVLPHSAHPLLKINHKPFRQRCDWKKWFGARGSRTDSDITNSGVDTNPIAFDDIPF